MDMTKEKANEVKDRSKEIIQYENREKKKLNKASGTS